MRSHGLVESPRDLGVNGHGCWGFERVDELGRPATAFLAEGSVLGQKLMFVGGLAAEDFVRSQEPMASMVRDGSLQIAPFDTIYPGGRRMTNEEQWALYAGATQQAIADGFTGLRVLAEVTSLAAEADGGRGQAAWETYADRLMADGKLAALCCFDRTVLSDDALAAIACVHPVVDAKLQTLVPFRIFAKHDALAVDGEVDALTSESLGEMLQLTAVDDDVVLDLGGLGFIDHNGVRTIEQHAARMEGRGGSLTLRDEPDVFRRLSDLLE